MKQVSQLISIAAACLSGVLLVLTAVLWVHTHLQGDAVQYVSHDFLASDPRIDRVNICYLGIDGSGAFGVGRFQTTIRWTSTPTFTGGDAAIAPGWHRLHPPLSPGAFLAQHDGYRARLGSFGFAHRSRTVKLRPDSPDEDVWAQVPTWSIMFAFAIWPAVTLIHFLRTRRRVAGRCAACGYDLRATPTRCPECGAAPRKVGDTVADAVIP